MTDYTLPTDKMEFAGDAEAIFLGRMEKLYGVGDGPKGAKPKGAVLDLCWIKNARENELEV